MFKTTNVYSYKERFIKDVNKAPRWGWYSILVIWLFILYALIPVKASDITGFSGVWASTPKAEWELPSDVLVGAYNEYQHYWMNYAWRTYQSEEFMYLLKAENGLFNHDRRHNPAGNAVGVDWGFCGTNDYWHRDKVNDPRFFNDPAWQLDRCYEMYKNGTKFYGLDKVRRNYAYRNQIAKHFNFK